MSSASAAWAALAPRAMLACTSPGRSSNSFDVRPAWIMWSSSWTPWRAGTPSAVSVRPSLERLGFRRGNPGVTKRGARLIQSRRQEAHGRYHALGRHTLSASFQGFLDQRLDRESPRRGVLRNCLHGLHDGCGGTTFQTRRDVLRRQGAARRQVRRDSDDRDGEPGGAHSVRAPCLVTATTLFRRPNPSSIAGAAGSATQRRPSTTNAY